MPRFVILEHDHPTLHWDLMLEEGDVLKTWRLATPPPPSGGVVRAEPIGDHRLAYLDYEGPVSVARGHVKRWDHGTYAVEGIRYRLEGEKWSGTAEPCLVGAEWGMAFAVEAGQNEAE